LNFKCLKKKNCDYVFFFFFIAVVTIYEESCIKFLSFLTQRILLTSIAKKNLNKLKIRNVRKQHKTCQDILKMWWCKINANLKIRWKCLVSIVICFRIALRTKIDFVKNWFCVEILFFLIFFFCISRHF